MDDRPLDRREQTAFDTLVAQLAADDRRFAARERRRSPRAPSRPVAWHAAVAALRPTVTYVRRVNYEGVEVTRRTLALPRKLIAILGAGVVFLAVITEPYEPDTALTSTTEATERTEIPSTADMPDDRQSEAAR